MELWDLYDSNGEKTGEVWERKHGNYKEIPEGRFHLVSDILVKHTDGSYLLVKRRDDKDVYPGFWEASAGGSAQAGETPVEAAKRELFEETGIKAADFKLIARAFREKSHCLVYSFFTVVDCPKDSVVIQKEEAVEYKWVDAKGLIEYAESDFSIKTSVERYKPVYDEARKEIGLL